jgi:hypothetical protein
VQHEAAVAALLDSHKAALSEQVLTGAALQVALYRPL